MLKLANLVVVTALICVTALPSSASGTHSVSRAPVWHVVGQTGDHIRLRCTTPARTVSGSIVAALWDDGGAGWVFEAGYWSVGGPRESRITVGLLGASASMDEQAKVVPDEGSASPMSVELFASIPPALDGDTTYGMCGSTEELSAATLTFNDVERSRSGVGTSEILSLADFYGAGVAYSGGVGVSPVGILRRTVESQGFLAVIPKTGVACVQPPDGTSTCSQPGSSFGVTAPIVAKTFGDWEAQVLGATTVPRESVLWLLRTDTRPAVPGV